MTFFKTLANIIASTNFYVVSIRNRDKWYLITRKGESAVHLKLWRESCFLPEEIIEIKVNFETPRHQVDFEGFEQVSRNQ